MGMATRNGSKHTHTYTCTHMFVMEQQHNNKSKMAARPRSLWFRIQNYKHRHFWCSGRGVYVGYVGQLVVEIELKLN